ncbi:MAG: hypothetical protein U0269_05995 [Polyangiales bacterium]
MNPSVDSSNAELALFSLAASIGAIAALIGYALLRVRSKGAFGTRVVHVESPSHGPYRAGWLTKMITLDASLVLRIAAGLALAFGLAESAARLAVVALRWAAIEPFVREAYQSEHAATAEGSALWSWWTSSFAAAHRELMLWLCVTLAPVLANAASAVCAALLLRGRRIPSALAGAALLAIATRAAELVCSAGFAGHLPGLPPRALAPNTGALLATPVAIFSALALYFVGRRASDDSR